MWQHHLQIRRLLLQFRSILLEMQLMLRMYLKQLMQASPEPQSQIAKMLQIQLHKLPSMRKQVVKALSPLKVIALALLVAIVKSHNQSVLLPRTFQVKISATKILKIFHNYKWGMKMSMIIHVQWAIRKMLLFPLVFCHTPIRGRRRFKKTKSTIIGRNSSDRLKTITILIQRMKIESEFSISKSDF